MLCLPIAGSAAAFSLDDIQFWVGTGSNRCALVIDWFEESLDPPALAWGYRWDGSASGEDMLMAIVEEDDRLFAKLGNFYGFPVLFGLGYDTDGDGQFGAAKTDLEGHTTPIEFDEQTGIAYGDIPDEDEITAEPTDPGDFYVEGWFTGFWHYGNETKTPGGLPTNPFGDGSWMENSSSMSDRTLVDGSWDSWAFETPAYPPPFTAYAENPQAALPPWGLTGDYDDSGSVDDGDYQLWKSTFGLTGDQAADGNGDGVVDAADYTVWRDHLGLPTGAATMTDAVPEPGAAVLAFVGLLFSPALMMAPRGAMATARSDHARRSICMPTRSRGHGTRAYGSD